MTETSGFTARRALLALRRRAWIVILCVLVGGGAAFFFSRQQTKQYTASASLLFEQSSLGQQASGLPAAPSVETDRQAATNVQLVTTLGRLDAATAAATDHGLTPGAIHAAVTVVPSGTTNIATVSATLPSPTLAALVANTYAQQFIQDRKIAAQRTVDDALRQVQQQIAGMTRAQRSTLAGQDAVSRAESLKVLEAIQDGNVQLVQRAGVPKTPSSPKTGRNTLLGLVLGLLAGLALVLVIERFDRRLRDVHELETTFGTSVLGQVPESPALASAGGGDGGRALIVLSPDAEAFRLLRAHLRYFNIDRKLRSIQVTSVRPGDGKSTVAWNLAATVASMGTRTLLLEADLRRPVLARVLGANPTPGMAQILVGEASVEEAIQTIPVSSHMNGHTPNTQLEVLVAGAVPPNPAELIDSSAMRNLVEWASEHYELVIIDAPPPGLVSDPVPLLAAVDGVLVVSRVGEHTRDAAKRLRNDLQRIDAHVLGLVINGFRPSAGYDGYGYGYGGYYGESVNEPKGWRFWRRSRQRDRTRVVDANQSADLAVNGSRAAEGGDGHDEVVAVTDMD